MRRFIRRFWRYYKWHFTFGVLVLICLAFVYSNMTAQVSADLSFGYVGTQYVNTQSFMDNKAELELLIKDANSDGKKLAAIFASTGDLQRDIDEAFEELIDSGSYNIYIASKETFRNYKDKTVFADAAMYSSFNKKDIKTLKNSSGKIYAVSLEDNTLAERLGFLNPDNLYIAVASPKKKVLSDYEKNGLNIAGYIIDNKQKYVK